MFNRICRSLSRNIMQQHIINKHSEYTTNKEYNICLIKFVDTRDQHYHTITKMNDKCKCCHVVGRTITKMNY